MSTFKVKLVTTEGKHFEATVIARDLETAKVYADAFSAIEGHKLDKVLAVWEKGMYGWDKVAI